MLDTWQPRPTHPDDVAAWLQQRMWTDDTLGSVLADRLRAATDVPFTIRSGLHPWSGSCAEVLEVARRTAGGLQALGVRPGDVVAFQLPNWMEAAATFYGAAMLGAVVAPVVHFYGPAELRHILEQSRARVLVTADRFGSIDYLERLDGMRRSLPALEQVVAVSSGASTSAADVTPFEQVSAAAPLAAPVTVDPSWPALIAYTSGTTCAPKGVVHTHRTILAEIRQLSAVQPQSLPSLVGAPVGHGIGMLAALLLPAYRGLPIHLIDVWDPETVLAAMLEDRVMSGTGATYFLTSLLESPSFSAAHVELMRHIGLGGSAVPLAVAERATALGMSVVRLYGSTEHPSITGCTHEDPLDKRLRTDGRVLPGVQLRVVDDDRRDLPAGEPGLLLSRGPDCFAGYVDPELTRQVFDADGWYDTEDVGVLDEDGFLSITDRRKDIIIRGGENISAVEVEEVLMRMPGVAEVAVVAAPDARLGEHACAFVRPVAGASAPGLEDVRTAMSAAGLARQKWPEEIREAVDLPRTASGKVQKFALRDRLRAEAAG